MSATAGYGLCGILDAESSLKQQKQWLTEFACKGFTSSFYEVISKRCFQVTYESECSAIEEIKGRKAQEIVKAWRKGYASLSFDDWVQLEADIFVPGYRGEMQRVSFSNNYDEETQVCGAEEALEYVMENNKNFDDASYLIAVLSTAIEQRFLFTVTQ